MENQENTNLIILEDDNIRLEQAVKLHKTEAEKMKQEFLTAVKQLLTEVRFLTKWNLIHGLSMLNEITIRILFMKTGQLLQLFLQSVNQMGKSSG